MKEKDEKPKTDYSALRRRFELDYCVKCRNVGVVRMLFEDVGTLVLCDCKQGKSQSWKLPRITDPIMLTKKHAPLPVDEFGPGVGFHSQEKGIKFIRERLGWWYEKIRVAEEFWKEKLKKKGE